MDLVKKFAIGAGIAYGAVWLDTKAREYAAKEGSAVKPDSFLIKWATPIAGGGLLLAAHKLGAL